MFLWWKLCAVGVEVPDARSRSCDNMIYLFFCFPSGCIVHPISFLKTISEKWKWICESESYIVHPIYFHKTISDKKKWKWIWTWIKICFHLKAFVISLIIFSASGFVFLSKVSLTNITPSAKPSALSTSVTQTRHLMCTFEQQQKTFTAWYISKHNNKCWDSIKHILDPPLLVHLRPMEHLLEHLVHLAVLQRQCHVEVLDDLQKCYFSLFLINEIGFSQNLPDEVVVQCVFPLLRL